MKVHRLEQPELVKRLIQTGTRRAHNDVVGATFLNHVRHQLGRDGSPTLVLAVLPCIRIERDYSRDALGAGDFAGVDHDAELHKRRVDRDGAISAGTTRVDDVDIGLANGFEDAERRFPRMVLGDLRLANCQADPGVVRARKSSF